MYSHMSNKAKNVKYPFYWGQSTFNLVLQITAGKFKKSVSIHSPSHAENTVACSKGKVSGHPAYESNEETHIKKSQSSSFGKSCI